MKQTAWLLIIIFLFAAPAYGKAEESAFSDVSVSDWFYEDVMELRDAGVLNGYEDGTFRPYEVMTCAEFVCALARTADAYISPRSKQYWAVDYLERTALFWMWNEEEASLIRPKDENGMPHIIFDDYTPQQLQALMDYFEQPIDRKRACRYLIQMIYEPLSCDLERLKEQTLDIGDMESSKYILTAYSKGIVGGDGNGNLLPDKLLTRAEACALLNRGKLNLERRLPAPAGLYDQCPKIIQAEFYGTDLFLMDENKSVYYLSEEETHASYPEKVMEQIQFLNQNLAVAWNHDLYGLKGNVVNYPGKGVSYVPREYAIRVLEGVQSVAVGGGVAGGEYFALDMQGNLYHYFSGQEKGVDFCKVMEGVKKLADLVRNDTFSETDEVYALTKTGELFHLDTQIPDGAPVLCDTCVSDITGGETVWVEKEDGTKYCIDTSFYTIPIPSHIRKASVDRQGIGCYIDDKDQLFCNFVPGKEFAEFEKLADHAADIKMGKGNLVFINRQGEAFLYGNLGGNYRSGSNNKKLLHKIYIKETEGVQ